PVDFELPEGSPVTASAPGRVIAVRQDSDRGGPEPAMKAFSNLVLIDHGGGFFPRYEDLQQGSVEGRAGGAVNGGAGGGKWGQTGQCNVPCLRFALLDALERSVAPRFIELRGDGTPARDAQCTSKNDGSGTGPFLGGTLAAGDLYGFCGFQLAEGLPA